MKVLLLTNVIVPQFSEINNNKKAVTGGWVHTVVDFLCDQSDIELAVCMPDKKALKIITGVKGRAKYYFFPEKKRNKYLEETEEYFKQIIEQFQPDIINIFGTEYPRTLAMVNAAGPNRIIITLAGIITLCAEHYMGQMPNKYHRFSFRVLLRPLFKIPTLWEGQCDFKYRGKYEVEAIKKAKYIIGRTRFDKAFVYDVNKSIHYFHCNETLRQSFYENEWRYETCIPHRIMLPQAGYPIKGFEVFLKALIRLKSKYPDVKAVVPGGSVFTKRHDFKHKILIFASDYNSYLNRFINQHDLWDNIEFTGLLDEQEMVDKMKTCNVFVLPSAIENSPNTLGEAMLLGMPCVASCVGGVQDLMKDGQEGYIYPYDEPHIMAYQISTYFENPKLAIEMGVNAKQKALSTHDKEHNMNKLLQIYEEVISLNE